MMIITTSINNTHHFPSLTYSPPAPTSHRSPPPTATPHPVPSLSISHYPLPVSLPAPTSHSSPRPAPLSPPPPLPPSHLPFRRSTLNPTTSLISVMLTCAYLCRNCITVTVALSFMMYSDSSSLENNFHGFGTSVEGKESSLM